MNFKLIVVMVCLLMAVSWQQSAHWLLVLVNDFQIKCDRRKPEYILYKRTIILSRSMVTLSRAVVTKCTTMFRLTTLHFAHTVHVCFPLLLTVNSRGASSLPGQSMWDLWWTNWHWDRLFPA
jgi:hypothetical protein